MTGSYFFFLDAQILIYNVWWKQEVVLALMVWCVLRDGVGCESGVEFWP